MSVIDDFAFKIGVMFGFAAGLAFAEYEPPPKKRRNKPNHYYKEDVIVFDYIKNKKQVYIEDVIGYLGWDDDRSARLSAGYVMSRLGWDRRRKMVDGVNRWYYQRGLNALTKLDESKPVIGE